MGIYKLCNTCGTRFGINAREHKRRRVVKVGPIRIMPRRDLELSEELYEKFKTDIERNVSEGLLDVAFVGNPNEKPVKNAEDSPKDSKDKSEDEKIEVGEEKSGDKKPEDVKDDIVNTDVKFTKEDKKDAENDKPDEPNEKSTKKRRKRRKKKDE